MDHIIDAFNSFAGLKGKKDDDFFDRLSSRYTVVVLLCFAAVITFYQFNGYPIICWFPVHFHESHMKFANSYCWIKNTYYLPYEHEIPGADEEGRHMVTYYQWVPFILLLQALLFTLPSLVWHGCNSKAGVDSDNILAAANMLTKAEKEEAREGILALLTNQIDRFLGTRRAVQSFAGSKLKQWLTSCCHLCGRRFGTYLVILYLFSKLLYIANAFFQLFILNHVLHTDYSSYGLEVMKGLAADDDWHNSPYVAFPRVTMCDFNVRRLGNVHRYTVQCALPLNLFNEKIYVFLWFWLVFVLVSSVLSLLQWFFRVVCRSDRKLFIKNHLTARGGRRQESLALEVDDRLIDEFVDDYLRHDGAFVLRLISHNTNNITTTDITLSLWEHWRQAGLAKAGKSHLGNSRDAFSADRLSLKHIDEESDV